MLPEGEPLPGRWVVSILVTGDEDGYLCGSNQLRGTVLLTGNQGGVEVSQNTLNGNLIVNATSGNGADHGGYLEDLGTEIEGNTVYGAIVCATNTPPPSDDGQPNQATSRSGQCAGPGF